MEELYQKFKQSNGVCTDTRNIIANSMFFALKGPSFNANEFALDALKAGCKYAVIDEAAFAIDDRFIVVDNVLSCLQTLSAYHRSQLTIPVIGITGSNGKTTSKELIFSVLSKKFNCYATKGNLNNHIGVPLTLLSIKEDVEIAIVEMGANHAGEIEFLCDFSKPSHGLITNIGKAHLEGFGNIDVIIETKTALYRSLQERNGLTFVNKSDDLLMELSENNRCMYYPDHSTLWSESRQGDSAFLEFDLKDTHESFPVKTQLIGSYNLDNALAAACIGKHFGISLKDIKDALEQYSPSNNRSQWKQGKRNGMILDAYNANPSSTLLAVENFIQSKLENKIIILGDMLELGPKEVSEHQKIIDLIEEKDEKAILIGPIYARCTIGSKSLSFNSTDSAIEDYDWASLEGHNVLIKGSRGLQLEKVSELL